MSLILALDTATDVASVALGDAQGVLAEVVIGQRRHATALVPAITEVLQLGDATLSDLDRILLADGPGSFTGLRIGAATAQGLARAHTSIAVEVTPSLLVAAYRAAAHATGPVASLYDALRGEVFGAVFHFAAGGVEVLVPPTLGTVEALAGASPVRPAVAVGDGAIAHAAAVRAWTGREPVGPPAGGPRASAMLSLRGVRNALTPVEDLTRFEPAYGRPAEAQVRWERAHGRPVPDPPGNLR